VARNRYAIGFFGLAYYEANRRTLDAVALAAHKGESYVAPEPSAVLTRRYPLSRPLFLYVRLSALERPVVQEFVGYYLRRTDLVRTARYVPLTALQKREEQRKLAKAIR
jgi:phosphate transport system substrate-binding protein